MDRILVEVFVPVADKTFDVYIPRRISIHRVSLLMAQVFTELLEGYLIPCDGTTIFHRDTGRALDINRSADEQGLKHGSRLMLF